VEWAVIRLIGNKIVQWRFVIMYMSILPNIREDLESARQKRTEYILKSGLDVNSEKRSLRREEVTASK
jgi:hypothetical protein